MATAHPTDRRYTKRGIRITCHTAADGARSYGTHIRLKGFRAIWKSYPTESECIAWATTTASELKKQRQQGSAHPDLPGLTVATLAAAYLSDPATISEHVPQYVGALRRSLEWWSLHYGAVKVLEFGPLQQREARDTLLAGTVRGGKKRSPTTVLLRMAAMRSCWRWGQAAGLVPRDHAWAPRLMPRAAKARVRYLSDIELQNLLTAAKAHSTVLHAAIVTAIGTGVRQGELLRLEWKDVDFARSRIQLLETKNGEARAVHLPPSAAAALRELKALPIVGKSVFLAPDGKPLMWGVLDKLWRVTRTEAGLKDFRWHDLRHTAASYLAQGGATLHEIGGVLGHRSAGVTMKYAHLVQGAPVTGHDKLDAKLRGR